MEVHIRLLLCASVFRSFVHLFLFGRRSIYTCIDTDIQGRYLLLAPTKHQDILPCRIIPIPSRTRRAPERLKVLAPDIKTNISYHYISPCKISSFKTRRISQLRSNSPHHHQVSPTESLVLRLYNPSSSSLGWNGLFPSSICAASSRFRYPSNPVALMISDSEFRPLREGIRLLVGLPEGSEWL